MAFSSGNSRNNYNRSLQRSGGGSILKGELQLGGAGETSKYNEKFSKELSKSTLERSREKARDEVKKERMRSFMYMAILSPIVIVTLWVVVQFYLKLLSFG